MEVSGQLHVLATSPTKNNGTALIQWDKAFELSTVLLLIEWQFFVTQLLPF